MVFIQHSTVYLPYGSTPNWAVVLLTRVFRLGGPGVDLFFVLSAYLITELLLREKEATGKVHVEAFYARRILRIWPLYFTGIAIGWAAQFVWHSQHLPMTYVWWFLALGGNWVCAFHGWPHSIASPLWSVSIEEQFYLTWPWAVRNLTRRRLRNLTLVLLIIPTLTRAYLAWHKYPQIMFGCNTFTRLDPILAGILLSVYLKGRAVRLSRGTRILLFVGGLAGVSWMSHFHTHPTLANMVVAYPLGTIFVVLMFISVLGAAEAEFKWMNRPTPRYLGKISYGLYVFHLLGMLITTTLLVRIMKLSEPSFVIALVTSFCVTVLLAAASYKFLEGPFLKLKDRFTYVLSDRPVSRVWRAKGSDKPAPFTLPQAKVEHAVPHSREGI
jgi:peptidoglycan/LPS O-acetylase OafA/YrhL